MEVRRGEIVFAGAALGPLRFACRERTAPEERSLLTVGEELARFETARRQAVLETAACYDRALPRVGKDAATVFAIHAMLLEDEDLEAGVYAQIAGGATADWAVYQTGQDFARAFACMEDRYMRARAADIADIARRLLDSLSPGPENPLPLGERVILAAHRFLPSEIIDLDLENVAGIIAGTSNGSSHAAMLLRACGIPSVLGVDIDPVWAGHAALLDGAGAVYLDPEEEVIARIMG